MHPFSLIGCSVYRFNPTPFVLIVAFDFKLGKRRMASYWCWQCCSICFMLFHWLRFGIFFFEEYSFVLTALWYFGCFPWMIWQTIRNSGQGEGGKHLLAHTQQCNTAAPKYATVRLDLDQIPHKWNICPIEGDEVKTVAYLYTNRITS